MTVTMLKPAPSRTLPPPLAVEVLRQNLTQALSLLTDASSKRATLPILGFYLLEANHEEQRLYLSATNLEVGLRLYISAQVETSGRLAVPVVLFSNFIRETQDDQVRLMSEPRLRRLLVQCGKLKASINGLEADEFPAVFQRSEAPALQFETEALRHLIQLTTFACSTEIARPVLQGVHLSTGSGKMTLAGADSFRISIAEMKHEGEVLSSCILPATALALLDKVLQADTTSTHVRLQIETKSFARAVFQTDTALMTIAMIEGEFPDYAAIVPHGYNSTAKFSPGALKQALKAVDVIAREGGAHTARFHFSPLHVALSVINSAGDGDGDVECDFSESQTDRPEGVPFTISFNTRYMIEALDLISETQAQLGMTSVNGIACLSPIGSEMIDWKYLVMPMAIGESKPPETPPTPAA